MFILIACNFNHQHRHRFGPPYENRATRATPMWLLHRAMLPTQEMALNLQTQNLQREGVEKEKLITLGTRGWRRNAKCSHADCNASGSVSCMASQQMYFRNYLHTCLGARQGRKANAIIINLAHNTIEDSSVLLQPACVCVDVGSAWTHDEAWLSSPPIPSPILSSLTNLSQRKSKSQRTGV